MAAESEPADSTPWLSVVVPAKNEAENIELVASGIADACAPFAPFEIIYVDDAKVLCRRWSWRGGEPSKISPATTNAVLNVHGLAPATLEEITRATETLATLVREVCGGGSTWYVQHEGRPIVATEAPVRS